MQSTAFFCDACGRNLDEAKDAAPIVCAINFGVTPIAQARHPDGYDFSKVALPEALRAFLAQPVPQLHVCTDCFPGVAQAFVGGAPKTATGERRALHASRQKAVDAFIADGFVSVRPEHPNRVIREQNRKAEAARLAQQAPVETAAEKRARLQRELAELDAPAPTPNKRAAKKKAAAGGS